MVRRALFLDRDGVINADHGYVSRREDFHFQAGIFDLVRLARRLGLLPIVVTNQSGIGRGYYDEAAFLGLTRWMAGRFAEEEAPIAAVYYCPHHPEATDEAYRADHPWRKPLPGMLTAARDDFGLDLSASLIVGDNLTDVRAGLSAGLMATLLLREQPMEAAIRDRPTAQLGDLAAVAAWLAAHFEPAAEPLPRAEAAPVVRRA